MKNKYVCIQTYPFTPTYTSRTSTRSSGNGQPPIARPWTRTQTLSWNHQYTRQTTGASNEDGHLTKHTKEASLDASQTTAKWDSALAHRKRCRDVFRLLIKVNKKKIDLHTLYKPECSSVTALMALTSGVSLFDLVNLKSSLLCQVFLKLRKCC